MMYFWLIPLVLAAVISLWILYKAIVRDAPPDTTNPSRRSDKEIKP